MHLMQCKLTALLALAGLLSLQPVARAADAPAPAKPAAAERGDVLRERLQQLTKDLKLSDEQRDQVQTIVRDRIEKLRELRQDTALSQAEKMDKFKALREELTAEVKKVLTPEQVEKWKEKPGQLLTPAQSPLDQLQEALKQLNLTEEQKEKLKPVYQEQLEKLRSLRQDASLSLPEKLQKLKDMRQAIAPQVKKVLEPAQFAKWDKSMDRWMEDLKQRFQGQP